jgi:hypothetical protein
MVGEKMHEKFPCKSHKYQDRLRIVASRKAIQQANDRRIHHSSDWCQLHLIIWAGCGLGGSPLGRTTRERSVSSIGQVQREGGRV